MTELSKGRRSALAVLAGGPAKPGLQTVIDRIADQTVRIVHHEPAEWLVEHGYAVRRGGLVEITRLGERVREANA